MKFNITITTHNDRMTGWAYGPGAVDRPHEAYQAIAADVMAGGDWYPLAVSVVSLVNALGGITERPVEVVLIRISEIETIKVAQFDAGVHG